MNVEETLVLGDGFDRGSDEIDSSINVLSMQTSLIPGRIWFNDEIEQKCMSSLS